MMSSGMLSSVQFIDNYFPVIDGVTETVHEYARHMDAVVVCPEMESRYLERHAFPYRLLAAKTIRVPFSRYASAVPSLDRSLQDRIMEGKPAVLHFHSPSMLGKYAAELGHRMGIPVVGTFHSKYYDAILEFTKSRAVARRVTDGIIRLYEKCDEVWACSEETGETLRQYGYAKPYYVMPNGTDVTYPENAEELRERAISRYQLPRDRHTLLFVGQQIWYKNQRLILDAFRRVCDRRNDFFLIMAGTGKDEEAIRRYASSLKLGEDRIRFTGQIADRELLRGVYLQADLLFFPSVFDNAPLVVREAAALGTPSLLTEGSNAAGAVEKNRNGYTASADPESMCLEIIRIFTEGDPAKTGENARKTIPLSWEKLIPMVQERYRKILDHYERRG